MIRTRPKAIVDLLREPAAVHRLKDGEYALVNGRVFVMSVMKSDLVEGIFFTSLDSKCDEYNARAMSGDEVRYQDFITHVRIGYPCVNSRAAFEVAFRNRSFHLG